MVMSNTPLITAPNDEHGEARRSGHRLTILHPGKFVEPCNYHSIVIERDCAPIANDVLITTPLQR